MARLTGASPGPAPRRRVARTVVALASVLLLAGCMTIRYGSPPRTDQLVTLTPGVSSAADVRSALGEPRGQGVARLASVDPTPRTIWSYEYTEAEGSQIRLKMLLVFFNQDRYEGYLWFGAANLVEGTE
jgi:hypothetical protein